MNRMTLVLLVVLLALSGSTQAITVQEASALNDLLSFFPSLLQVYRDPSNPDYGTSWRYITASDALSICAGAAGYELHGLHCDGFGHIDGLL